jgi:ribosome-binding protein aMBF1 (putative translation factor)
MTPERAVISEPPDTESDMEPAQSAQPSPLGAGFLILVTREPNGPSQRALGAKIGTPQPNLATLESGNRLPTVRTLRRIARAGGRELVIGLREQGPAHDTEDDGTEAHP